MSTPRREFIKQTGIAASALALNVHVPLVKGSDKQSDSMVAMQIAPFDPLDEGIEACLDRVLLANVNTLFMYSHTYYGIPYTRTANVLADDHGIIQRDDVDRVFNPVWVKQSESYKDTSLRFNKPRGSVEHQGRDIFNEIQKPAAERGIKVCARLLEPGTTEVKGWIENWDKVASVDAYGNKGIEPCRSNPEYQAWCVGMVEDLFQNYDLAGYQWGAERSGPFAEVMERGKLTGCFCPHCLERGKALGIDPKRARDGFLEVS